MFKETFIETKEVIKKIIVAIIFILIFNFLFANLGNNVVFAEKNVGEELSDEEVMETEGGGKFLLPIHAFVLFLADAVLEIMQNNFISQQSVTIKATSKDMSEVNGWAIFGIVLGTAIVVGACIVTCRGSRTCCGCSYNVRTWSSCVCSCCTWWNYFRRCSCNWWSGRHGCCEC